MGFDQYHEPPEELPAETRTFARLCASLTEEAEAIGWYEQRLAVEPDPEARGGHDGRASARSTSTSRWTSSSCCAGRPSGARSPRGAVPGGRHRRARRGRRGGGRRGRERGRRASPGGVAGHRQPAGEGVVNHLLREHAPITDDGWKLIDEEARERLPPRARRAPPGRLRRPARLGALRHQPRPRRGGRRDACERRRGPARRVLPLVELRAPLGSPRASCAPATAAPRTSTSTTLDARRAPDRERREHGGLPRLERGRHRRASPRPRRTRRSPPATTSTTTPAASPRRSSCCCAAASRARTDWRWAPTATPRSSRPPSTAATRCSTHLRKILEGPIVWAPGVERRGRGQPARRRLPVRVRPGSRRRLRGATTPTRSSSTSRSRFSFRVATPEAAVAIR